MLHNKHTRELHNRSNIFAVAPFYHPAQPSAVMPFNDLQKCSCSYLYYLHLPINYNRKYFQHTIPLPNEKTFNTTRKKLGIILYKRIKEVRISPVQSDWLDGIWVTFLMAGFFAIFYKF